jgi:hypothetical protein
MPTADTATLRGNNSARPRYRFQVNASVRAGARLTLAKDDREVPTLTT